MCLRWDGFGNPHIMMHVQIWSIHILREVSVRRGLNITPVNIPYRLWGRMVVSCIMIDPGCVDVAGVLHFTSHDLIPSWLWDAFPRSTLLVIMSHMRVLKNGTYE